MRQCWSCFWQQRPRAAPKTFVSRILQFSICTSVLCSDTISSPPNSPKCSKELQKKNPKKMKTIENISWDQQSQGPFGFQLLHGSENVILHEVRLRAADLHQLHLPRRQWHERRKKTWKNDKIYSSMCIYMYPFIYTFIDLFSYLFIYLFIYSSILYIYLSICLFMHLSIYISIDMFLYLFMLSTYLFCLLFICCLIYSFVYVSIYSHIYTWCANVCVSVCLCAYMSIYA